MKIELKRFLAKPGVTLGHLYIDGSHEAFTCEDELRQGPKVPGKTCIPAGTYFVGITWSPRFKRKLPLVLNVPGFEGIRIHPGNTPEDTDGCILPGAALLPNDAGVGASRIAFNVIYDMIAKAHDAGDVVELTVTNP